MTSLLSPRADALFLVVAPLFVLASVAAVQLLAGSPDHSLRYEVLVFLLLARPLVDQPHIILVLFRSHLNREIFSAHPFRFVVLPVILLVGCFLSDWVLVPMTAAIPLWDIYHASMQTFGIGRIYDRKFGNEVSKGRFAEMLFCFTLYLVPILVGVNFWTLVQLILSYAWVGRSTLSTIHELVLENMMGIRLTTLVLLLPVIGFFLFDLRKRYEAGYQLPPRKLLFWNVNAFLWTVTWGVLDYRYAIVVLVFNHSLQYFFVVWSVERTRLIELLGKAKLALLFMVGICGLYGIVYVAKVSLRPVLAFATVLSILHFWYDGFIWSVRKQQI